MMLATVYEPVWFRILAVWYDLIILHRIRYDWPYVAAKLSVSTFRKSFSETEVRRLTDLL